MSHGKKYKICKWCYNRPGGCLYCIVENAETEEAKAFLLNRAIERGEAAVVAVRQEAVLVQVFESMSEQHGRTPTSADVREDLRDKCSVDHVWSYDAGNLKRRHCARPGCTASQVFIATPQNTKSNGYWLLESLVPLFGVLPSGSSPKPPKGGTPNLKRKAR